MDSCPLPLALFNRLLDPVSFPSLIHTHGHRHSQTDTGTDRQTDINTGGQRQRQRERQTEEKDKHMNFCNLPEGTSLSSTPGTTPSAMNPTWTVCRSIQQVKLKLRDLSAEVLVHAGYHNYSIVDYSDLSPQF